MSFTFLRKKAMSSFLAKRLVWYAEQGREITPEIKAQTHEVMKDPQPFVNKLIENIHKLDKDIADYQKFSGDSQYQETITKLKECRANLMEALKKL